MANQQEFGECAYCGEPFDKHIHRKNSAHIIPRNRGGCDHLPNLVDACDECNKGQGGQWTLTPIEWWAKQEWEKEDGVDGVSAFDYGGWTLRQRRQFLLQAAYWEARARWHLRREHQKVAKFRKI